MAVLVTRPHPDNQATAAALRDQGIAAMLAPMLRFQPEQYLDEIEADFSAVVATSANALRAIRGMPLLKSLVSLPLFVVGGHTAEAGRELGFGNVIDADGNAADLRARIKRDLGQSRKKRSATLLYLAGADLAQDLAGQLGDDGFTVITQTTYRMVPETNLPAEVANAFGSGDIEAVMHYSRRSARAFVDAVRAAGVEIAALSSPQCCLSDAIAMVLRDAGALRVSVAETPDEAALFACLSRALGRGSR